MYVTFGKCNLEKSFFSKELARIIDRNAKKEHWQTFYSLIRIQMKTQYDKKHQIYVF